MLDNTRREYVIDVYYNDDNKKIRILKNMPLGSLIEVLLNFFKLYIYSLEDIIIKMENGDEVSITEFDINKKILDFGDLSKLKIYLKEREYGEDGNVKNRENSFITGYLEYIRMRDDSKLAEEYQHYFDNTFVTPTENENSEFNRSVMYNNLIRSVGGLNSTYNRLNRGYSPRIRSSLNSQTENYNNLFSNLSNNYMSNGGVRNREEVIDMEFTYTEPLDNNNTENEEQDNEENVDSSGNEVPSDNVNSRTGTRSWFNNSSSSGSGSVNNGFYQSIMNNFTDMINRNNRTSDGRPISNFSFQYQTVPITSYSNVLNNLMGGLNGSGTGYNLDEDVKMVLTDDEISKLKVMKKCEIPDLNESEEHKCTVCLDEMKDEEEIILLDCNHFFHKKCIETWFKNCSNKCPICRVEVAKGVPDFRNR